MLPSELITTILVLRMSSKEYRSWVSNPCLLAQEFQDPSYTQIEVVVHVFQALLKTLKLTAKQLKARVNSINSMGASSLTSIRVKLARTLLQKELGLVRDVTSNLKVDLDELNNTL